MRLIVIFTMAAGLAFPFTSGAADSINVNDWAEAEISGSYEAGKGVISIELTEAQAEKIANAKGKDVEIELTESQIRALADASGFKNIKKTLTLNKTHLQSGSKVVIKFLSPDNYVATDDLWMDLPKR
jgi:hypothetical protein